jgi:hypothetical protein
MSVGFGPTFRGIKPARGVGRMKFFLVSLAIVSCLFLPSEARAQMTSPSLPATGPYFGGLSLGTESLFVYADVEIDVQGPKGVPLEGPAVVSLIKLNGQVYYQTTVRNGIARFHNVANSELTAQVVALGYQTAKKGFEIFDRAEAKVKIDLQPMSDKEAAADRGIAALTPTTQKEHAWFQPLSSVRGGRQTAHQCAESCCGSWQHVPLVERTLAPRQWKLGPLLSTESAA